MISLYTPCPWVLVLVCGKKVSLQLLFPGCSCCPRKKAGNPRLYVFPFPPFLYTFFFGFFPAALLVLGRVKKKSKVPPLICLPCIFLSFFFFFRSVSVSRSHSGNIFSVWLENYKKSARKSGWKGGGKGARGVCLFVQVFSQLCVLVRGGKEDDSLLLGVGEVAKWRICRRRSVSRASPSAVGIPLSFLGLLGQPGFSPSFPAHTHTLLGGGGDVCLILTVLHFIAPGNCPSGGWVCTHKDPIPFSEGYSTLVRYSLLN